MRAVLGLLMGLRIFMPTPQDQERIGTLLAVLSGDQDFVKYKHKITDAFIAQTELFDCKPL
ncbi:hypothetical protein [Zooshikella ganghwensis]|uniref:hypothetical protein n=1 Tax=Zooshikella ganghwensis TaxID=202772 RepID=UPI00040C3D3C|nr:hypothetical protein [Zooshikella ganghwensis]